MRFTLKAFDGYFGLGFALDTETDEFVIVLGPMEFVVSWGTPVVAKRTN